MMKIIVCVKAVPDPKIADKIKIDSVTKSLPRVDIPLTVNPLDRNALEAAVKLKETQDAHITVISMGPPPAGEVVKECLALGADTGILLSDKAFAGADAFATAYTLAKAIEKAGPMDVVFCGTSSSDGATEWVGPEIAAFLDLPVVTMVREIVEDQGDQWIVHADFERGYRKVKLKLPAVLTVTRNLNQPKALSFSGILKARKKEISIWDHQELGVSPEVVGLNGSPTHVTEMTSLESRREGEILEGCLDDKVDRVVNILSEAGVLDG